MESRSYVYGLSCFKFDWVLSMRTKPIGLKSKVFKKTLYLKDINQLKTVIDIIWAKNKTVSLVFIYVYWLIVLSGMRLMIVKIVYKLLLTINVWGSTIILIKVAHHPNFEPNNFKNFKNSPTIKMYINST